MPVVPAAIDVAKQTLLILTPELFLLTIAIAMMTAGAFVKFPRRVWSSIATGSLLVAFLILLLHQNLATPLYSAVALNDTFSVDVRVFFLVAGLILLAKTRQSFPNLQPTQPLRIPTDARRPSRD